LVMNRPKSILQIYDLSHDLATGMSNKSRWMILDSARKSLCKPWSNPMIWSGFDLVTRVRLLGLIAPQTPSQPSIPRSVFMTRLLSHGVCDTLVFNASSGRFGSPAESAKPLLPRKSIPVAKDGGRASASPLGVPGFLRYRAAAETLAGRDAEERKDEHWMRIALIIPMNDSTAEKSFYDYRFYRDFLFSKKYISYLLAIPTLISLTQKHHEIRVFDENIEKIDFSWKPDIVGISVRTMFAKRAYSISETYRKMGVKTVLGGIHPSMCPDEAIEHCDSIVIGEAEEVWPTLLQDAEEGHLQRVYNAGRFAELKSFAMPSRSLLSQDNYLVDIVQTSKGCPFDCEFCSVHAFDGQQIRHRTVVQVIEDVQSINRSSTTYKKNHAVLFADDNIISNKKYAKELFLALKPYNLNWSCQASINISQEDELLELMRDSGCGAVFIGFESISDENLSAMHKRVNQRYDYSEAINKIQSYGILVQSSFIVGYDFDSPATLAELSAFIQESNLLMPLINILTPFPGTRLFNRLEEEGRIRHKDWSQYDTKHVVFSPLRMSPEELLAGYRSVVKAAYSFDSILSKLEHYWKIDFWKRSNQLDPVKFTYRCLFAIRLATLLLSGSRDRSRFVIKILPKVFDKRVRISTILTLMAYNDFAYSL
jgi:radical SAM superfamily enzyme YgiQ (UPF0313 family)